MKKLKQTEPLVSVVMTAFNAVDFIDEAIASIANQSYPHLEMIIVDDGSTDRTWKHIGAWKKRDRHIRAYRLPKNVGPSDASNFAIAKAHGEYIARMDADDVSYPDRITKQVAFLETHPTVVLVGGQCDVIDEAGSVIGEKHFPTTHESIADRLFIVNPLPHPACMYRKSVFIDGEIAYEKKYFVSHDLKILFKLLSVGKLANVPETVLRYRLRPNSITHTNPKRTFAETIEIRRWALLRGFYKPSPKAMIVHTAQALIVPLLPNAVITKLFLFWRLKQPIKSIAKAARLSFSNRPKFGFETINLIFFLGLIGEKK